MPETMLCKIIVPLSAVSYEDNTTSGYHLEHPVHQSGREF